MPHVTIDEFESLTRKTTPLASVFNLSTEELESGLATVRLPFKAEFVRAGGTVSGPAMMMLADYAMYAVVMSVAEHGEQGVTANFNINFLRRPAPRDVIAKARLIRCGKRLAFCEVFIYSDGEAEPVAHVTGSYSIPAQGAPGKTS